MYPVGIKILLQVRAVVPPFAMTTDKFLDVIVLKVSYLITCDFYFRGNNILLFLYWMEKKKN